MSESRAESVSDNEARNEEEVQMRLRGVLAAALEQDRQARQHAQKQRPQQHGQAPRQHGDDIGRDEPVTAPQQPRQDPAAHSPIYAL